MPKRLVVAMLVTVSSCGGERTAFFHPTPVDSAFNVAMARGSGAVASLDRLGPASWTTFYVFGPYTSDDMMRRCLATSEFEPYGLDRRDDIYALYFRNRAGTISSMTIPRTTVQFAADALGREYPRGSASFVVRRASGAGHLELAPIGGSARHCS